MARRSDAEPGDHEERVVDRNCKADQDHELGRVRAGRRDQLAEDAEDAECREERRDGQDERHDDGHEGPEGDQQDDEGQADRDERPVEAAVDESVMSWLVSVWLTEWTMNPALLVSIAAIAGADRDKVASDLGLVAVDPGDDPDGEPSGDNEEGRRRGAVADPGPGRRPGRSAPPSSTVSARAVHDAGHKCLEGRVGRLSVGCVTTIETSSVGVARPARVEDRVGLRRLGLAPRSGCRSDRRS